MAEKKKSDKKVKKIERLNMGINEFGELTSNINLDEINAFLNHNVEDKKLNEKKTKDKKDWKINSGQFQSPAIVLFHDPPFPNILFLYIRPQTYRYDIYNV